MSGIITQNVLDSSGLIKAPAAGGTWVEIKSLTASGTATLSFVDGTSDVVFDSTYPVYCFRWFNMHPATDNAAFSFNFSDDGSNYDLSKTTIYFENQRDESGGDAGGSGVLQYNAGNDVQGTGFQVMSYQDATGADDNAGGYMYIFAPSDTTFVKHFSSRQHANDNYVVCRGTFVAGYVNTTAAITAVQFKYSSGNMDAGTVKLFGIKDS